MGAIEARRHDPPASVPHGPYPSVKDAMRAAVDTPGEWWLVALYDTVHTARNVAYQFRRGLYSRKPPVPGRWEYRGAKLEWDDTDGRTAGLWARYLGPDE